MYLQRAFGGRNADRSGKQDMKPAMVPVRSRGKTVRGRRARMWVAASSVLAMVLVGATPALAEGEAEGEQTSAQDMQTMQTAPSEPAPAPPSAPEPEPAPAPDAVPPPAPPAPAPPPPAPEVAPTASTSAPESGNSSTTAGSPAAEGSIASDAPMNAPAEPPFLKWRVIDLNGVLQAGTTITVQGPSDTAIEDDEFWQSVAVTSVKDNTGDASYLGADVDPRPGFFTVKSLADDANPASIYEVAAAEHYRVRPAEASGFNVGEDSSWFRIGSLNAADATSADLVLETPEAVAEAPPVEEPDALQKQLTEGLEQGEESIGLLSVGPEEDIAGPYVYWNATDENGDLVGGATFTIQGPRSNSQTGNDNSNSQWTSNVATVIDCIEAPCFGSDLDPEAGEFLVKTVASHEIRADRRYRVQQSTAPVGYSFTDASFHKILGIGQNPQSGQWQSQTFEFAPFVMQIFDGKRSYHSTPFDNSNPGTWTNGGDPCTACEISDFTSEYVQVGSAWVLQASWTRPTGTGNMGWSIEYTNADERWGGSPVSVPRPDRSAGGIVVRITNDNDASYETELCTYTSQNNYPGTCSPVNPVPLTRDGNTMHLNLTLPSTVVGNAGCPSTLGSTGYLRSWTGTSKGLQAWTEPAAVEPPSNCGNTTLKVTKMGDRNGVELISGDSLTQAAPVPGATYTAFASTSGANAQPTGPALGSCVTTPSGTCEIVVLNGQPNGVWVVETGTPAGWSNMPDLGIGSYNSAKTVTPYRFRVSVGMGSMDVTRNVTKDSDLPSTNNSNAWVDVRDNPGFPEYCGVSIAMVFDTSTSINSGEMEQFIDAGQLFVGNSALGGTPSKATLFEFNTTASTINGGTAYDLSIAGSEGSNTGYIGASAKIENALPSSGSGFTNWDSALRLVKSTGSYDMVLFMTDGDPTTYANGSNTTTTVPFRTVEQAVMSANALKASPGATSAATKIVGVGVGLAAGSDQNLKAITGPTSGDDYFLADNFEDLETKLQEIALKNCGGTVTVTKRTLDADNQVIAEPAGGWEFTASTNGAFIKNPPGADVASLAKTTPSSPAGSVNFAIDLDSASSRSVSIAETPQTQWTPVSVDCGPTPVTGSADGFSVTVSRSAVVSCVVTNKEKPKEASVTASKVWVITDGQNNEIFRSHDPAQGGDDDLPPGISAQLNVTGPGASGASALAWGATRGGYQVGDVATITETVSIASSLPGCTVASQKITELNGDATDINLADGASHALTLMTRSPATTPLNLNEIEVTNTVKCVTKLSLLKNVGPGGSAQPDDWTLTAAGSGSPAPVTGADTVLPANTFEVTAASDYTLSEAPSNPGSPVAYLLDSVQPCALVVGGTCNGWGPAIDVSTVQVPLGTHAIYRFVNVPAPAVTVPHTGGLSGDLFGLGGIGVAALAALLAVLYWRRMRQQAGVR